MDWKPVLSLKGETPDETKRVHGTRKSSQDYCTNPQQTNRNTTNLKYREERVHRTTEQPKQRELTGIHC